MLQSGEQGLYKNHEVLMINVIKLNKYSPPLNTRLSQISDNWVIYIMTPGHLSSNTQVTVSNLSNEHTRDKIVFLKDLEAC